MEHNSAKLFYERNSIQESPVSLECNKQKAPSVNSERTSEAVPEAAILCHGDDEILRECARMLEESTILIVLANGHEAAQVIAQIDYMCENKLRPSEDQLMQIYKTCMNRKNDANSISEILKTIADYHHNVFVLDPDQVHKERRSKFFAALFGPGIDLSDLPALTTLSLTSVVTKQFMEELYRSPCKGSRHIIAECPCLIHSNFFSKKNKDHLSQVGAFLSSLFANDHQQHIYEDGNFNKDPAQHLFLWSTIFNEFHLAKLFWKISKTRIAGAVMAAAVFKAISEKAQNAEERELSDSYLTNSHKFENISKCLLDDCWEHSQQLTTSLLVRPDPSWGNCTILSMAHYGELQGVFSTPACYTKLRQIWRGDIPMRTTTWKVLVVSIMPLLVFLLEFKHEKDYGDNSKNSSLVKKRLKTYFYDIYKALSSPIIKCIHYGLSFLVFLTIYGFFLMTELKPVEIFSTNRTNSSNNTDQSSDSNSIQLCINYYNLDGYWQICFFEVATYAYSIHLAADRFVQFSKKKRKRKNIKWRKEAPFIVDLLALALIAVGYILRYTLKEKDFTWVRWFYVIAYVLYVQRFTQIFYPFPTLGPKFIIITNMIAEVGFVVIFLAIIVILFGVVYHSLVYTGAELNSELIRKIPYQSYFQIYGELFLEDYTGSNSVVLGFYLLLTNVLVLNLLIAMFSNTFQKYQEQAEILWKYNYYEAVHEHYDRPYVPIIGYLYTILNKPKHVKDEGPAFKFDDSDKNEEIDEMLDECTQTYIERRLDDIAETAVNTTERLDLLRHDLDLHRAEMKRVTRDLASQLQSLATKIDQQQHQKFSLHRN